MKQKKHFPHYEGLCNNLDLFGVKSQKFAFGGPELASIDLTNKCNLNCNACWIHSPYMIKDKRLKREIKKELDFEIVKKLINDLEELGTKRINLSGGGEPTVHPKFMEIVELIKSKKFHLNINTNFVLLNEEKIDKLINLGVNHFTVSVWAGSPNVYVKTHPGTEERTFYHLKSMLSYLSTKSRIGLNVYNVISRENYKDIWNMIDFAREVKASSIEFTIVDVIPKVTEFLRLRTKDRVWLLNECKKIKRMKDDLEKHGLEIWNLDIFMQRLKPGFNVVENNKKLVDKIPCNIGWTYARIMANGNVIPCCKAYLFPTGNLYKNNFKEIWFSKKHQEFRIKAQKLKKNNPYFKLINCERSCDNIINNIETIERLRIMKNEIKKIKDEKEMVIELSKENKSLYEKLNELHKELSNLRGEIDQKNHQLALLNNRINEIINSRGYRIGMKVDRFIRKITLKKRKKQKTLITSNKVKNE
ncbi:MAG: radical SAM protein [Candidatus Woesearchaeota archaeon]